jgi:hypothetical protein
MSDAVSPNLHLKSVLLTAVFLLASLGPMLAMPAPVETTHRFPSRPATDMIWQELQ